MTSAKDADLNRMGLDRQNISQIPDGVAIQPEDFHFYTRLQPFEPTRYFQQGKWADGIAEVHSHHGHHSQWVDGFLHRKADAIGSLGRSPMKEN